MTKLTTFLLRWGPALLMMAAIFGFSSVPSEAMLNFGLLDYLVKKGGHAFGYGLLSLSYLRGLKGEKDGIDARWFYQSWVMAVVYSGTDEFHQSFVPGRYPAISDVMIDAFGAALTLFLVYRYSKQK